MHLLNGLGLEEELGGDVMVMVVMVRGLMVMVIKMMMVVPTSHILGTSIGLHCAPARHPLSQYLSGGPVLIIIDVVLLRRLLL